MSERPEMITVSYVPGGTAEVHVSLPGSASNSARSSGPSAADVIFASSKLGPADPLFFCVRGLSEIEPPPAGANQEKKLQAEVSRPSAPPYRMR